MYIDSQYYEHMIGHTKDDEISDALESCADVISVIGDAMSMDDENDSEQLLNMYLSADEEGKAFLDSVLVCICGYGMSSIIGQIL